MRTGAPRPARLLRLGACHSPRRGGECGLRCCARDVTGRPGAPRRLCGARRLGSPGAAVLAERPFARSRRHAPGARSAALRGRRRLQLRVRAAGAAAAAAPWPVPPAPGAAERGGWCRAAAPSRAAVQPSSRAAEQPSSRAAVQPCSRAAEQPCSRAAEQPCSRPGGAGPAGLRAAERGPPAPPRRAPGLRVPKTRGHSLISAVGCNRAGKEQFQGGAVAPGQYKQHSQFCRTLSRSVRESSFCPELTLQSAAGTSNSQEGREDSHHSISEGVHCQSFDFLFGQTFLQGNYYRCTIRGTHP